MKILDEFINKYTGNGGLSPGFSLAVAQDGRLIYDRHFGLSNLEDKVPIGMDTCFYTASLAKSFTAAGIMLLKERADLNLNDSIIKYFPNLHKCYSNVNIINLINHTSGVKDYFNICESNNRSYENLTNEDVYNIIKKEYELENQCNSKFSYSNTGYVLLTLLIERLSNQRFSDFLKDNFLKPLDMKETYVFTEDKPVIPNRAYGYKKSQGKYCSYDYSGLTTGDGGMYISMKDLMLWMESFDNERIFNGKIINEMFTSNKLLDGNEGKYGFGWFILQREGKKVVFHAGNYNGFTNIMVKIPEDKISIAVLTNCYEDVWQVIFKNVYDFAMEIKSLLL